MSKFILGRVIARFTYDFDGEIMEVVKFHPWKADGISLCVGKPNMEETHFHCDDLHESSLTLHGLIITWIANKRLGLNQHSLVAGIRRALDIK